MKTYLNPTPEKITNKETAELWEKSEGWHILHGDCHGEIEANRENVIIEGDNYGTIENVYGRVIILGNNFGNILTIHESIGILGDNHGQLGSIHGNIIVTKNNRGHISTTHNPIHIGGAHGRTSSVHSKEIKKWDGKDARDLIYYIKHDREEKISMYEDLGLKSPHSKFGKKNFEEESFYKNYQKPSQSEKSLTLKDKIKGAIGKFLK